MVFKIQQPNQVGIMKQKKSIFRIGAIKFILLFLFSTIMYLNFFFDSHMEAITTIALEKMHNAQVDVKGLKTNFFPPSLRLKTLAFTNKQKPLKNSVEIKDINIVLLGDALLRAKLVIDKIKIKDISLQTQRQSKGRIYPQTSSNISKKVFSFSKKEIKNLGKKNDHNPLGIVISLIGGDSLNDVQGNIKKNLKSDQKIKKLEQDLSKKRKSWQKSKDLILQKIDSYNDFKLSKNVKLAMKQISKAKKDYRETKIIIKEFKTEVSDFKRDVELLKKDLKSDLGVLNSYTQIPTVDLKDELNKLLINYLKDEFSSTVALAADIRAKIPQQVTQVIQNKMEKKKKNNTQTIDMELDRARRASNEVYRFPRDGGYPMFWLKEFDFSLKKKNKINLFASFINISTSPPLVKKWPKATLLVNGDNLSFKKLKINAHMKEDSKVHFIGAVGPILKDEIKILSEKRFSWKITQARDKSNFKGYFGVKDFQLIVNKEIDQFKTKIITNSKQANSILNPAFNDVRPLKVEAKISGGYNSPNLSIKTDAPDMIGENIKTAVNKMIKNEINNKKKLARTKINKKISLLESSYKKEKNKLLKGLQIKSLNFSKLKNDLLQNKLKNVDLKKNLNKLKKLF
jgi:uncharacterized protein (TIGR03545 family)